MQTWIGVTMKLHVTFIVRFYILNFDIDDSNMCITHCLFISVFSLLITLIRFDSLRKLAVFTGVDNKKVFRGFEIFNRGEVNLV